jgi:hypothetical protein
MLFELSRLRSMPGTFSEVRATDRIVTAFDDPAGASGADLQSAGDAR